MTAAGSSMPRPTAPRQLPGRPPFGAGAAAALVRELFGVDGRAEELPSEDRVFLIRSLSAAGDPGERFVLKLSNANEQLPILEAENRVLVHLENARLAGRPLPPTPRVLKSVHGQRLERVTAEGESSASCSASGSANHYARLLDWLPGRLWAEVRPHTAELRRSLGVGLARLDLCLAELDEPAARRWLEWDLHRAGEVMARHLELHAAPRRLVVESVLERFRVLEPRLEKLPKSLLHNDANDLNLLVGVDGVRSMTLVGLLDFGDLVEAARVCELAIALAYAVLDQAQPFAAAASVVAGYHEVAPLDAAELEVLFDLVIARLGVTVSLAAYQHQLEPDNPYLVVSEAPAWRTLERLLAVPPPLALALLREACGLPPVPAGVALGRRLRQRRGSFAPVLGEPLLESAVILDLSVGSPLAAGVTGPGDMARLAATLSETISGAGARIGIGRHDEARSWYVTDQFRSPAGEPRTVHLGIDLFAPAGSAVHGPLDGVVHSLADNAELLDYGPTVILRHRVAVGSKEEEEEAAEAAALQSADSEPLEFFTLYGHLSRASLDRLAPGQRVAAGALLGHLGKAEENGGWPPHLHVQLILDLLGHSGNFPGVGPPGQRRVWTELCPDPSLLLGLPPAASGETSKGELLERRRRVLAPNLSLSYDTPLWIARGAGAWLYDHEGRVFLDLVNNVCHVGHAHPRVARAVADQMRVLNTNTRYLSELRLRYCERLVETFPEPLAVCYLVCSGSEANDLALRLARAHTGRRDVVCLEGAYHGNLTSTIEVSPYKHDGPGGAGAPPWVHTARIPDTFRGPWRRGDAQAARRYAEDVDRAIAEAAPGGGVAAFLCESLPSCAGQIELPAGYLDDAYRRVRAAGGVCIADEVQVGFGRVGSRFWGFETQDVVPDIVTLGKPMGNGHPLGAVITTREIAGSFDNGMEYFNSYGGNLVSCAAGLAVLDAVRDERLQQRALEQGERLRARLCELGERFPLIGDVRGRGLFLGVELVRDRSTLEPAAEEARYLVERLRERGFLLSVDGSLHNVLKIKPPLVIAGEELDRFVAALADTLAETPLQGAVHEMDRDQKT